MISAARVYLEGIKTSVASRMAYRGDFFISITMLLIMEMGAPVVTFLIYNTGAAFPGWSFYDVMLLQGIFLISKGISFPFFFGIVHTTLGRVNNGTFDLILLKPRSSLFITLISSFEIDSLGQLFAGLWLFYIAYSHTISPGLLQWLSFALLMLVSLIIFLSFALIMSGIVIKWVGCGRVYEIFYSITSFGLYPRSIFNKVFQSILTYVVPIAAISFFPASMLLGKPISGVYAVIAVSILFLLASLAFWHKMLTSYTSAGG